MTEKELHKLRRPALLQLLLAQGREAAQLQKQIEQMAAELEQLRETNQRFIERMDDKDAQIERLKGRLNQKDTLIGEYRTVIEEYRSGRIFAMDGQVSIVEVGQKLEGIFAAAQKAVDQYLGRLHGEEQYPDTGTEDSEEPLPVKINDTGKQYEEETEPDSAAGSDIGAA